VRSRACAAIEAAAEEPDGARRAGHLSRKLGMSAEALRAQRAQSGLGWAICSSPIACPSRRTRRSRPRREMRGGRDWESVARGARRRPRAAGERRAHLGRDRRTAREDKGPHATTVPGSGKATAAAVAERSARILTMGRLDGRVALVTAGARLRPRDRAGLRAGGRRPRRQLQRERIGSGRGRDGDREGRPSRARHEGRCGQRARGARDDRGDAECASAVSDIS